MPIYDIQKLRDRSIDASISPDGKHLILESLYTGTTFYEIAADMLKDTDFSGMHRELLVNEMGKIMEETWVAQALSESR